MLEKKTLTNKQVIALLVFALGVVFSAMVFIRVEEKTYSSEMGVIKTDVEILKVLSKQTQGDVKEVRRDVKELILLFRKETPVAARPANWKIGG